METEHQKLQHQSAGLEPDQPQQNPVAEQLQQENRRLARQLQEQGQETLALKKALAQAEQDLANLQSRLEQLQNTLQGRVTGRITRLARWLSQSARQLATDWRGSPLKGALDPPPVTRVLSGSSLKLSGWAISRKGQIAKVELWWGKICLGLAHYGLLRPDVSAARPLDFKPNCGFALEINLPETGTERLRALVVDSQGRTLELTGPELTVEAPPLPPYPAKSGPFRYEDWIKINEPGEVELAVQRQESERLSYRPLLSLISGPLTDTTAVLEGLNLTLQSLVSQTYPHWEWWIAYRAGSTEIEPALAKLAGQESRVHLHLVPENSGFSEGWNAALAQTQGEFVAWLKADDTLAPNALYENVALLQRYPSAGLIYSDEDYLDTAGIRHDPAFKPDWSPDYLRSYNYTGQFSLYQAELVKMVGGFRPEFEEISGYDLTLRVVEQTGEIYHLPLLLYHNSAKPKPPAPEILVRSVAEHCRRLDLAVEVEPGLLAGTVRVRYRLPVETRPKVSIIIPTHDRVDLLQQCLESLDRLTTYRNFEVLVVDNQSREPASLDYFEQLRGQPNFRLLHYPHEFNFSALNNFAAAQAAGELLLFLNNDIELIEAGWLEALVEQAIRPEVGAVGARLLYPDRTLQHGGIILGIEGQAGHAQKHLPGEAEGYLKRAKVIQNFSAVTAACLMTRAALFRELGGFEESLTVAFNDVDYCLRLRRRGLLVVWTPYAELIHHESLSRGRDEFVAAKTARFRGEVQYMQRHWRNVIQDDPYYNPNLTLETEDFSLAPLARYRAYF